MKGSLKIGRIAGIQVGIHWTFLLLLGYLFLTSTNAKGEIDYSQFGHTALFIGCIFLCVLLHELGHSFAAMRYGIQTQDITLLPIGGLARLERMPEAPIQEFVVALAGPAVNLVIAAAIFTGLVIHPLPEYFGTDTFNLQHAFYLFTGHHHAVSIWEQLLVVNLYLLLFNLIPALPMDGGRVLRSLLAFKLDRMKATHISARIGQGFGILFVIMGFVQSNFMLPLIGLFVFNGAAGELEHANIKNYLHGFKVGDAMLINFRNFSIWDTVAEVFAAVNTGGGREFLVSNEGKPAGVIHQKQILKAIATGREDELLCKVMSKDIPFMNESQTLDQAMQWMEENKSAVVPVMRDGMVVGLLSFDRIMEFIQMQQYMHKMKKGRENQGNNPPLSNSSFVK